MGQTGCGKSTFINYLLGKLREFSTSNNQFKSKWGTYKHIIYPISIKDLEGFEVNSQEQKNKIYKCFYFDLIKKLKKLLEKISEKLQEWIFFVDVLKRELTTFGKQLNQIYNDLNVEKENIEFIKDIQRKKDKGSNYKIDFSGSEVIDKDTFVIPPKLGNSPFFNLKKFKNYNNRKDRAKRVIKDAQDVSSNRKIFFCYILNIKFNAKKNNIICFFIKIMINSKIKDNRKIVKANIVNLRI